MGVGFGVSRALGVVFVVSWGLVCERPGLLSEAPGPQFPVIYRWWSVIFMFFLGGSGGRFWMMFLGSSGGRMSVV